MAQSRISYCTILGDQIVQSIFLSLIEVAKVLTKIAKVSGCEAVSEW